MARPKDGTHASNWQPNIQGMGTPLPETEIRSARGKAEQQAAER
jgi:hypothetical protein